MDNDLPLFLFAHAVHSDVISTKVIYNNCRLTNVNLVQQLSPDKCEFGSI